MSTTILILILIIVLSIFFVWVAVRAWRTKKLALKIIGGTLISLVALLFIIVSIAGLIGLIKFTMPQNASVPDIQVAGTPEQVARGEDIANFFCASCHSLTNDLPLTGGMDMGSHSSIPIGSFFSANLTQKGRISEWSDGEVFRAIRNGIDKDGRKLMVMSSVRGRYLSDEDILAVIAYLRSQPAIGDSTANPPDQPSIVGLVLAGVGLIPMDGPLIEGVITAPKKAASSEYGEYILSYQDCRECHGQNLEGGASGQMAPLGPSLVILKGWTEEQFISTMRTGVDPYGHEINNEVMPWKNIGRMDDDELKAILMYVSSSP
jgi:mono/diheme cytochrome c family protein